MKILTYLNGVEGIGLGDVERATLRLADFWAREGHEVLLWLAGGQGVEGSDLLPRLTLLGPGLSETAGPPQTGLKLAKGLRSAVLRERPDLLFCPGNGYATPAIFAKALLANNCPPVVARISDVSERPDLRGWKATAHRGWLSAQGRYFDHFVGPSEAARAAMKRALGIGSDRIAIILDPILTRPEQRRLQGLNAPKAGKGRRFLSAGALDTAQNWPLLLQAFAEGASSEDRLDIVGEGPQRNRLEGLIAASGLSGRVHLHGYLGDLSPLLSASHHVVSSADHGVLPSILVQALAARRSIIATESSPVVRDLLAEGGCGLLIPTGDQAALTAALAAPPPEPDRRQADAAVAPHLIEQAGKDYLKLFRALV